MRELSKAPNAEARNPSHRALGGAESPLTLGPLGFQRDLRFGSRGTTATKPRVPINRRTGKLTGVRHLAMGVRRWGFSLLAWLFVDNGRSQQD